MKRFVAYLMVFLMCFMLIGCQDPGSWEFEYNGTTATTMNPESTGESADSATEGTAKPLLYRVTDETGNVVWLFGSVHVGRESYYPLPAYVMDAFNGAGSLAVEVDILAFEKDMGAQVKALTPLIYKDGTSIKDHISPALYADAVEALTALNSYMAPLDMYCPALWGSTIESLMIEQLGGDATLGIDRYLLNQADESGKEILEIESAQFQYQMLGNFSDELQALLLQSAVDMYRDPDAAREDMQELMDLWEGGDEQAFEAYMDADDPDMTAEDAALYEEYNQSMIIDRNLFMADYAEDALQSGKEVFICVGAAHVVGEGAMAQLLAQRGYTVECITQG